MRLVNCSVSKPATGNSGTQWRRSILVINVRILISKQQQKSKHKLSIRLASSYLHLDLYTVISLAIKSFTRSLFVAYMREVDHVLPLLKIVNYLFELTKTALLKAFSFCI